MFVVATMVRTWLLVTAQHTLGRTTYTLLDLLGIPTWYRTRTCTVLLPGRQPL